MSDPKRIIVFTDLDGTLLNRINFQWTDAEPAILRLKDLGVPIVFCSSKTLAEQVPLQKEMQITDPMIVENGSAVVFPPAIHCPVGLPHFGPAGYKAKLFGRDVNTIRDTLTSIREDLHLPFKCYHEMSDSELSELTGLHGDSISLARRRDFSETINMQCNDTQQARFENALQSFGLTTRSGGHLQTITAAVCNKGRAVQYLLDELYGLDSTPVSIGIGDSPNDADFLKVVDHAFQVQTPDNTWHNLQVYGLKRISAIGPVGWSASIEWVLSNLA